MQVASCCERLSGLCCSQAALGLSGKSDEALPLLESFTNTSQMTVRVPSDLGGRTLEGELTTL